MTKRFPFLFAAPTPGPTGGPALTGGGAAAACPRPCRRQASAPHRGRGGRSSSSYSIAAESEVRKNAPRRSHGPPGSRGSRTGPQMS